MNLDYTKFGFLPYQVAWLEDSSQIKIYEKSRRIGITYVQAFEDVLDAGIYGKYDVWFSSNNDLNAREYIRYCKKYADALNLVVKDLTAEEFVEESKTYSISFKNGFRITAVSSSPEQLHGKGGKMVLDEFARRDDEAETWEAASPAALIWNYPIRIISTHKGKRSMFNDFIRKIEQKKLNWSHHKTDFLEAVEQGLPDKVLGRKQTKKQKQSYVDKVRAQVGNSTIWSQQFMCLPQDESEAFIPYSLLEPNAKTELVKFEELTGCKSLYAGLDIGRVKHLSVLWIVEKVSSTQFITRFIRVIEGVDFPTQEKIVSQFVSLPNFRRLCVDRTGLGIGLTDYLQKHHGTFKVEGVNFSGPIKEKIAFRVQKTLQDHCFNLPDEESLKDDFNSVKQEVTTAGNIRLKADTNKDTNSHADFFWAAALSLEAASNSSLEFDPAGIRSSSSRELGHQGRLGTLLKGFER